MGAFLVTDPLTWTLDGNYKLTISGSGSMDDYTYNTMPWYSYKDQVKSISIGSGVTWIGDYAFYYMSNMTTPVTIPASVTHIGNSAFYLYSASSITFNEGLAEIGSLAFAESELTSVTLPSTLWSIGDNAFRYQKWYGSTNNPLKSVTIKNGPTLIGDQAFYGCNALTTITIPASVNTIGDGAFAYCLSLTNVSLPDSLKVIGSYAFGECSNLYSFTMPGKVETIGEGAFSNSGIRGTIYLPETFVSLGDEAFSNCTRISSIAFLGSAPAFGEDCFKDDMLTAYYSGTDATWTANVRQQYGGTVAWQPNMVNASGTCGDVLSWSSHHAEQVTSLNILDNVTRIGNNAFAGFTNLETVVMADSVTSIGDGAFEGCTALTNVTLSQNLESIGANAFQGCSALSQIDLPEGLSAIGAGAFAGCTALTELTVPESVTTMGEGCIDSTATINAVAGSAAAEYAKSNGNRTNLHTHTWGAPTWSWQADDAATATFVCQDDASHVKALSASVSQTVIKEATYLEEGSKLCMAVVALDGQAYSDARTAAIPKLDSLDNAITGTADRGVPPPGYLQ